MQGEFYPGNDIRGRQQGKFYPGILVAHGPHPGSAMTNQVHLTVTSPMTGRRRWVFLLRMLISYPGAQINDSMQAE